MRYLRLGSQGQDVLAWKYFLRGIDPNIFIKAIDDLFDQDTKNATMIFQRSVGFKDNDVDGVVGNMTYAKAASLGFSIAIDESSDDELGPNWPPKPNIISNVDREKVFGKFAYSAMPTILNPEAIKITDDWVSKNIILVEIPQLKNVKGAPKNCQVQFHKLIAKQIQDLFVEWEKAGFQHKILTWGGSWTPRFIRGSNKTLSTHAWGTAFDINVQWNMLGTIPALKDKKGSVRELVTMISEFGLFWGGWFVKRPDGMHFEVYKIL